MNQSDNLALRLKRRDIKAINSVLSQFLKDDMISVEVKNAADNTVDINLSSDRDIFESWTCKSIQSILESSGIQEISSFCIYAVDSRSSKNLWQYRFQISPPRLEKVNIVDKKKIEESIETNKSKSLAILLALFTGVFGGHKFYLGEYSKGWLYLLFFWTYIPVILTFFDILYLLSMSSTKFHKMYSVSTNPSKPLNSQDKSQNNKYPNHKYDSEVIKMMDYFKLVSLLGNKQWHQADLLTKLIMLKLVGRNDNTGWLRPEDIDAISIKDLAILDMIWMKSSEGCYGFSSQLIVWKAVGSPFSNNDDWERFGVNVGWRTRSKWKISGKQLWRWDSKEMGHLPFSCFLRPGLVGVGTQRAWLGVSKLCEKLEESGNYLEDMEVLNFIKLVVAYMKVIESSEDSDDGSVAELIQIRLDKIEETLKEQNWNKADHETKALLYEIVSCEEEGFLEIEHITQFSKYVWIKLDDLWTKYSNKKYGFSTQQRIWKAMGSPRYSHDAWEDFGQKLGWLIDGHWINNNEVQYTDAPTGHLPSVDSMWRVLHNRTLGAQYGRIVYLFLCDYFE